jgi:hypothetical protein
MKQFDLGKALAGHQVITRSKHTVVGLEYYDNTDPASSLIGRVKI